MAFKTWSTKEYEMMAAATIPVTCSNMLHPGISHFEYFLRTFRTAFRRSLRFYFPIYMLPMVIFQFRSLLRNPIKEIVATGKA